MIYEKANIITSPLERERWKMEGDHGDRCQVCRRPTSAYQWRGFAIHHIIGGANVRSDEPCNFLLVCARCHDMVYNGPGGHRDERTGEPLPIITLGHTLWIKSHTDEWDEDRLTALYHQALPAWDILPSYYMDERCRWARVAA